MKVRQIIQREIQIKLVVPFETSVETTDLRRIILIEADVDGVIGWGECVAAETPSYSPETVDTAWHIQRDFLWPLLKDKEFVSAGDVWGLFEHVRGHNMAKGAIEAAIWDAEARQKNLPLWKLLGGVPGKSLSRNGLGARRTASGRPGAWRD